MAKQSKTRVPLIDELEARLAGMNDHDRRNFQALVALPTSLVVIAKMPEGKYR